MSDEILVILLRIIKNNIDVSSILNIGIRYSQIPTLIEVATKKDYLIDINGRLTVTSKGHIFLKNYLDTNKLKGIERWISTRKEFMVTPIGKYDIVLPKR